MEALHGRPPDDAAWVVAVGDPVVATDDRLPFVVLRTRAGVSVSVTTSWKRQVAEITSPLEAAAEHRMAPAGGTAVSDTVTGDDARRVQPDGPGAEVAGAPQSGTNCGRPGPRKTLE